MTGRNFDIALTVSNAANFEATNTVVGATSGATGVIANADPATNTIKVKLNNVLVEFQSGEVVNSNVTLVTDENLFVTYHNDQDTLVDSNGFIIDGSSQVFAIPETSNTIIFKDHIRVFSNGNVLVSADEYTYPSTSNTISDKEVTSGDVNSGGSGYLIGDILTLVGGTARAGLKANVRVDNVSAISATVLAPGTGYTPQDNITVLGGVTHISNAKATINVVQAVTGTVVAAGSGYIPQNNLIVSGGVALSNTIYSANTVKVVTTVISAAGTGYTVNDVINLVGGTSTAQAVVNVTAVGGGGEVTTVVLNTVGSYSIVPSNAVSTTGGGGTGFTTNINYGIDTLSIQTAGAYTTIPSNPVSVTGDGGQDATITADYGASILTINNAGDYSVTPADPVTVTGDGNNDATFTLTYNVNAISIVEAGQYSTIPSNPQPISASGGSGSGFTGFFVFFNILRRILNRGITFNSPVGGSVANLVLQVVRGIKAAGTFMPGSDQEEIVTASSTITGLTSSPFIAEKNAFEQKPLVRLYTIFYPGEWFPPNAKGNPTNDGAGLSWPFGFPFRFAEIRGEIISDLQYSVLFGGIEYTPYPIDSSGVALDSSGRINEVTLTLSNFDNVITTLVENPFLVGNNTANAQSAIVNEETVGNIDPRTIIGNPLFDQAVADSRGGNNLAFDVTSTTEVGGTWIRGKQDTRDLLGAVVEIKSTFANFLDVWPEYSTVRGTFGNGIEMFTTLPYRIGDTITGNNTNANSTVINIRGQFLITNNSQFSGEVAIGDRVYIENPEADSENFVLDSFKVNSLDALNDSAAAFGLTSWLQFFKLQLPKRRFFKNTCAWVYKGDECQYPDSGTGPIVGNPTKTANGFFNINNETVVNLVEDVCARNLIACNIRNNGIHFGGWPGTGRTIPR